MRWATLIISHKVCPNLHTSLLNSDYFECINGQSAHCEECENAVKVCLQFTVKTKKKRKRKRQIKKITGVDSGKCNVAVHDLAQHYQCPN